MNHLFDQYDQNISLLRELEEDILPRSLRLFNIRIRLAMDIQINFKGMVSLTKTKDVRDTYVLIVQLMELWNAYEALSHYVKEATTHVSKGVTKSRIYSQDYLKTVGSLPELANTAKNIQASYKSSRTFREDFDSYIERVERDKNLSKSLKADAINIRKYVKGEKIISGIEILSLIYAERNMYYHNGETAKMGMRYSNRKKLITWYKDVLLDNILKIANSIIIERIEDNR